MTIVWVALWAVTYCELIIDPGPSFEPTHLRKKRSKKGCAAKYRLFLPSNLFSFPALFVSALFSWLVFTYPWLLSDTWPSDSLRFTFTPPSSLEPNRCPGVLHGAVGLCSLTRGPSQLIPVRIVPIVNLIEPPPQPTPPTQSFLCLLLTCILLYFPLSCVFPRTTNNHIVVHNCMLFYAYHYWITMSIGL